VPAHDTDYGGAAPLSYYWDSTYASATARDQSFEMLGPGYGPDGVTPSTNADGVTFSALTWVPGQTYDVTWLVRTLQPVDEYGYGEGLRLWVDFDRNGKWEADEEAAQTVGYPIGAPGTYSYTESFLVPMDAVAGLTWAHARMAYLERPEGSALSPSYAHSEWWWGESEDYQASIAAPATPELGSCSLLMCGAGVLVFLKRRRKED